MASKKTPYGYILAEGRIAVDVGEAEIIRRIFEEKVNGLSGSKIGATLFDEQILYFSEDKKKAVDKVYCILRDGRYCGADGYPPIITEDIFGASNIGNTVKKPKVPDTYTVLKKLSFCTVCGTNMVHFSDRTGFKRWRCTHKGCTNFQPRIPDDFFVSAVHSIMNAVVSEPDMLETDTPLTVYEPTDEIRQAEKEISQLCAAAPIEYELIKAKTLALAVMKYNACTYSREPYITQELQDIIADHELTNTIDTELLLQTISRITVDENKTIAIEFRNGKHITYKEENNAEE
ncbi:recombinase family protein [Ruminococcus sp.]|uniref:recombinase family protein n=1 Tax=Ruminococcus sp. TaxID=41978 RepID=UPI002587511E|nr:recombinase family protein [Ruminococcus sp.]MCR5019694.1 recombinase family protein [Ruminococcus sp.]